ncbi:hypothetical protein NQ314_001529 [Rhamnusium bicolor]|uniref:PiggyBac transposable element-derived protein domain-containing protein n=1 Tax=Rhamnusium bicolor TaxID=1586634 RepID=A0AAV8ZTZ7_9CUCU|nr:hypothetical protein NQ314_001529 [Rhamnusium bicolor]
MAKKYLWHHLRQCKMRKFQPNNEDPEGRRGPLNESSASLFDILGPKVDDSFRNDIIHKFRSDIVTDVCKEDMLIIKVGSFLYDKYEKAQSDLIRQSMRQLGRLKIELKKTCDSRSLSDWISTKYFDDIITATKSVCGNEINPLEKVTAFKIPSLALKIGYLLRKCVALESGAALRKGLIRRHNELKPFTELIDLEWAVKISSKALTTLHRKKINATQLLPLTNELMKLNEYLKEQIQLLKCQVQQNCTRQVWSNLASVTLSHTILFNKRRSGEAARMTLYNYSTRPSWSEQGTEELKNSLTSLESELANRLNVIEITGKRGRIVPVILTAEMKSSIDLLIKFREKGDVSPINTYTFVLTEQEISDSDEIVDMGYTNKLYYIGKDGHTQWKKHATNKRVKTRKENKYVRLPMARIRTRDLKEPLDIFRFFIEDTLLAIIVDNTNRYIDSIADKYTRESDCRRTNNEEIQALIGLLYYAGILKASHLNASDLWRTDGRDIMFLITLKMNKTGSFREGQRKLRVSGKEYQTQKKRVIPKKPEPDQQALMGLLHLGNIKRRRHGVYDNPECSRRQSTISYSIPLDGEFIQVCKSTFMHVFSVSKKRLEVSIRKKKMGDTFYKDRRTNNKKSKFSEVDREQIRQYILSIPREVSHYNRTKSTKEYLSPDLNINRLYRAFPEKFRSTAVSYKYYQSIFIKDFPNLSFHRPRVDTCRTCDRLQYEIAGNSNTAKTQLELHHREVEYSSLSMKNDFLKCADPTSVFDWLDGVTDEQAEHSDVGGDSDAEDVPLYTGLDKHTTRNSHLNSNVLSSESKLIGSNDEINMPSTSTAISYSTDGNLTYSHPKLTRHYQKKLVLADNSDDNDFFSDDSLLDPNYMDLIEEERRLLEEENNVSDVSDQESDSGYTRPENEIFDFCKQGSSPKTFLEYEFHERRPEPELCNIQNMEYSFRVAAIVAETEKESEKSISLWRDFGGQNLMSFPRGPMHPIEFIRKLSRSFDESGVPKLKRVELAISCLRRSVADWALAREGHFNDFSGFYDAFLRRYWGPEEGRKTFYKIQYCCYERGSPADYFLKLVREATYLSKQLREYELIECLVEHFEPEVRRVILSNAYNGIDEVEMFLRKIDGTYKTDHRRTDENVRGEILSENLNKNRNNFNGNASELKGMGRILTEPTIIGIYVSSGLASNVGRESGKGELRIVESCPTFNKEMNEHLLSEPTLDNCTDPIKKWFVLKDSVLYRRSEAGNEGLRVCVPRLHVEALVQQEHKENGHFGAINHDATGFTPFEVHFGRVCDEPILKNVGLPLKNCPNKDDMIAHQRLMRKAERRRIRHNSIHKYTTLAISDKVWVRTHPQSSGVDFKIKKNMFTHSGSLYSKDGKVLVQMALKMRLNDEEKYEQHDVSLNESDNEEKEYTLLSPVHFDEMLVTAEDYEQDSPNRQLSPSVEDKVLKTFNFKLRQQGDDFSELSIVNDYHQEFVKSQLSPPVEAFERNSDIPILDAAETAEKKKPTRKRKQEPSNWTRNVQRTLRMEGKAYQTQKGILKEAKTVAEIFNEFYDIKTEELRWNFIARHVRRIPKKRSYGAQKDCSRRQHTLVYKLTAGHTEHQVCQKFFLKTLQISSKKILAALDKSSGHGVVKPDQRGRKPPPQKKTEATKDIIRADIKSLPLIASHYCRSTTKWEYLPTGLSENRLYLDYKEYCAEIGVAPEKASFYKHIFTSEFNIGFHRPKKDQYDINAHLAREIEAREAKQVDKNRAKLDKSFICFAVNMEKILLTPSLQVGKLYYTQKLKTFNFTVYNLEIAQADNFMWHEGVGTKGSSEIVSSGKNHNYINAAMFLRAVYLLPIEIINQKYMESGHSEMECDSVHSAIENRGNKIDIYTPEERLNDSEFRSIVVKMASLRNSTSFQNEFIPKLYTSSLPIEKRKMMGLRKLCQSDSIKSAYYGFYEALRTTDEVQVDSDRRKLTI